MFLYRLSHLLQRRFKDYLHSIVSSKWHLNFIDIKNCVLQGKTIQWTQYLWLPKGATTKNIFRFNKCVYSLVDSCRYWYLRVKEKLLSLKGKISSAEHGIFTWYKDDQLIGIVVCFVDDKILGRRTNHQRFIKYFQNWSWKFREFYILWTGHLKSIYRTRKNSVLPTYQTIKRDQYQDQTRDTFQSLQCQHIN